MKLTSRTVRLRSFGMQCRNYLAPKRGEDEFGNRILQVYLGSCFSILPSGKYYTPFANSNVDLCKLCGGTGRGPLITCPYCEGLGERDYFEYNAANNRRRSRPS